MTLQTFPAPARSSVFLPKAMVPRSREAFRRWRHIRAPHRIRCLPAVVPDSRTDDSDGGRRRHSVETDVLTMNSLAKINGSVVTEASAGFPCRGVERQKVSVQRVQKI
jgi:hypothetical protein